MYECLSSLGSQARTYWVASLSLYVAFLMGFPHFSCVHYLGFLVYFSHFQVLKCVPRGWIAGNLISWINGVLICYIFASFTECYLLIITVLWGKNSLIQKYSTNIQCSLRALSHLWLYEFSEKIWANSIVTVCSGHFIKAYWMTSFPGIYYFILPTHILGDLFCNPV